MFAAELKEIRILLHVLGVFLNIFNDNIYILSATKFLNYLTLETFSTLHISSEFFLAIKRKLIYSNIFLKLPVILLYLSSFLFCFFLRENAMITFAAVGNRMLVSFINIAQVRT